MTGRDFLATPAGEFPSSKQLRDSLLSGAPLGILALGTPELVTIATGVATATRSLVQLAAEGGTADTVDTFVITGQKEGDIAIILADTGDTITVDDANIDLAAATRVLVAANSSTLILRFDGTSWVEVLFTAAADNAG